MPTLVPSDRSRYCVPKGALIFCIMSVKKYNDRNSYWNEWVSRDVPGARKENQLLHTQKDLYFCENEREHSDCDTLIFQLNPEDWSIARYIVVSFHHVNCLE